MSNQRNKVSVSIGNLNFQKLLFLVQSFQDHVHLLPHCFYQKYRSKFACQQCFQLVCSYWHFQKNQTLQNINLTFCICNTKTLFYLFFQKKTNDCPLCLDTLCCIDPWNDNNDDDHNTISKNCWCICLAKVSFFFPLFFFNSFFFSYIFDLKSIHHPKYPFHFKDCIHRLWFSFFSFI